MADQGKRDGRTTLQEIFAVMRTAELGPAEKVLWCLYRSYDGGAGAWPGDEALAAHMGRKLRSVEGYRSRLLDARFLVKEFRGPNPAVYRAVIPREAPQNPATLDPESPAESCDAEAKAPQEATQDSASPLYMNTGITEKTLETEISEKRSRYSPEQLQVIDAAIDAFRSTRKTNRIADSVILGEFVWWEGHTPDSVVEGLRTYSERGYATEGKGEKYARGIIRNNNGASARPQRSKKSGFPEVEDGKAGYLLERRAQSEGLSR